jgi:hypothetical protein
MLRKWLRPTENLIEELSDPIDARISFAALESPPIAFINICRQSAWANVAPGSIGMPFRFIALLMESGIGSEAKSA